MGRSLKHISFEITRRCNANCPQCVYRGNTPPEDLPIEKAVEFISRNKSYFGNITFTGGEPFLREDFGKITGYVQSLGKKATVISNASFQPELLDSIPIDGLKISMDFPDDRHDQWRGIPGLFSHITTEIIPELQDRSIPFEILCAANKRNLPELQKMVELGSEFNTTICFNRYIPTKPNHPLTLTPEDMQSIFQIVNDNDGVEYMGGLGCLISGKTGYCSAGLDKLHITNDGKISMCMFYLKTYGSINESLRKVHKRVINARCALSNRAYQECGECVHFNKKCWGDCLAVAETYGKMKGQCWM